MTKTELNQITLFLIDKVLTDTMATTEKPIDDQIRELINDEIDAYKATLKTLEASDMGDLTIYEEVKITHDRLSNFHEYLKTADFETDQFVTQLRDKIRMNAMQSILK